MNFQISALAAAVFISSTAHAASERFIVQEIQYTGLVRTTADFLNRQLPLKVGMVADQNSVAQSIKTLYATGKFSNVKAVKNADTLVFEVTERPVVVALNFEGNKSIPTDNLKDGLKAAGLQEGETLDPVLLTRVERDLEEQYITQGRYNADVVIDQVVEPSNNTAELNFKFYEGDPAKVLKISILGNEQVSTAEIMRVFDLREESWRTLLSKRDDYAQTKFRSSLEKLRSLYLDQGYIDFEVDHAVLNISEDKENVFIEVGVSEGERYTLTQVNFLGDQEFSQDQLQDQVAAKTPDFYSESLVTQTTEQVRRLYGNAGYYFAKVRPVPQIDKQAHTVALDYYVDPGKPVYVRRIRFTGNAKTEDQVLRREMRQLEGALASNDKIQRSAARLQRTGFFATVNYDVQPVPGTDDKIDVVYTVEEQPSGTTSLSAGYSQGGGVTFQAGLTQTNFMGTGNAVNIQLARAETYDDVAISLTDPYFTVDGISQSASVYYRETKSDNLNINNYLTDSIGARLIYGYPVDENIRISGGLGVDQTTVKAGESIAISNLQYLSENGLAVIEQTPDRNGGAVDTVDQRFEADFLSYNLNLGWSMDTRDQPLFPNKGMYHTANLEVAVPGSDVDYQKIQYSGNLYVPITDSMTTRFYTKLGYGNDLPFYKSFYAGGFGSVRGYENGSVGPRSESYLFAQGVTDDTGARVVDPDPEYVGGNALVQFGTELTLPMPFKGDWTRKVRPVIFAEGAQVFDTTDRADEFFQDSDIPLIEYNDAFRFSVGAGFTWLTPIGPISLSYAQPINDQEGDELEQVQFEIGRVF